MANSLRFGPPTASTAHLCVDMQNVFAEDTPWRTSWMERVRPVVAELARYKPHSTVFSRFIPPDRPEDAKGAWRRYFERWQDLTRQNIDPQLLELVPELQELVPPAVIFDKRVYSPFHDSRLSPYLRLRGNYAQFWCLGSGGGLLLGRLDGLAVAEADAFDHLGEAIRAVQMTPVTLGRFGELENHRERRLPRQAALRLGRPEPDGGEGTFDRIRRPNMFPVLGG